MTTGSRRDAWPNHACGCSACDRERVMHELARAIDSADAQFMGAVLVASVGRDADVEFVGAMVDHADDLSRAIGIGPHVRGAWRLIATALRTLRPAPAPAPEKADCADLAALNQRFIRHERL